MNNKFFWSAFYSELISQFSNLLQKKSRISFMGPWQILIYVSKENVEMEFNVIQMVIKNMNLWKFFEDESQILIDSISPNIKLVPLSSANYLRIFQNDLENSSVQVSEELSPSKSVKINRLQI